MPAIKRAILLPFTSLLLLVGAFALMLGANLYTFSRLSNESPIAELRFVRTGERQYQAIIAYGDFCKPHRYLLYGNQWRLDAVFLKWRSWANLLGFNSLYRIERLGGRYSDLKKENTDRHLAYALHPRGGIDLVAVLASYRSRISPVDTLYGSSVYGEMDPDYVYRIYRSQSGLLVRKALRSTVNHAGGVTTIEINKACARSPGMFKRTGHYLERLMGLSGGYGSSLSHGGGSHGRGRQSHS